MPLRLLFDFFEEHKIFTYVFNNDTRYSKSKHNKNYWKLLIYKTANQMRIKNKRSLTKQFTNHQHFCIFLLIPLRYSFIVYDNISAPISDFADFSTVLLEIRSGNRRGNAISLLI